MVEPVLVFAAAGEVGGVPAETVAGGEVDRLAVAAVVGEGGEEALVDVVEVDVVAVDVNVIGFGEKAEFQAEVIAPVGDAAVVCGDIALYAKGAARPTGGAGCVAMLIGPDAPIVFEPGLRGSYLTHAYDFFKPDLASEYPVVDGHFSLKCYTEAVDACYKAYNAREQVLKGVQNGSNGTHDASKPPLERFDHICFHAPTCKLVQKSYGRMLYNDYLANPSQPAFAEVAPEVRDVDYEKSLSDKNVEKTFMGLTKKSFAERVRPSLDVPALCGNMYTATVYAGLASLISNISFDPSQAKRIGFFSYGSGLASSMFSAKIVGDISYMAEKLDLHNRLNSRNVLPPQAYDDVRIPILFPQHPVRTTVTD